MFSTECAQPFKTPQLHLFTMDIRKLPQTAGDSLTVWDLDDLKGPMVREKMQVYHQVQADAAPKQYLPAILKDHDLVWHHMDFADAGPKVFLAKKCKKTGELVDLPSQELSGPGKMKLFLPYGQVGIASLKPENFWGLDDPTEVSFTCGGCRARSGF